MPTTPSVSLVFRIVVAPTAAGRRLVEGVSRRGGMGLVELPEGNQHQGEKQLL
jgi:hypothetical protein